MTGPTRIRVRARRNKHGCVFEFHPDDETAAKNLLAKPHYVVTLLYRAVDRSRVSDKDVVATLEVLPDSRQVDSIDVPTRKDSLSLDRLASLRDDIEASVRGERAHA